MNPAIERIDDDVRCLTWATFHIPSIAEVVAATKAVGLSLIPEGITRRRVLDQWVTTWIVRDLCQSRRCEVATEAILRRQGHLDPDGRVN